jgi:hypothetical protein
MDIPAFCQYVRTRCTRAQKLEGVFFNNLQMVICPTWEEKERLEGQGVFPLHADEAELYAVSEHLTRDDKDFLSNLMLKFQGIRVLGVE